MRPSSRSLLVCALTLGLFGCPRQSASPGSDAGVQRSDAGVRSAPPLSFRLRAGLADGGVRDEPLAEGRKLTLDPTSRLELTSNVPLLSYRVRLFDEVDRAMVSDDAQRDTAEGIDYQVVLPTPLQTGHRYTVVVDGQNSPQLTDAAGRTHGEQRFDLQVEGERKKEVAAPTKKTSKKTTHTAHSKKKRKH